MMYALSFNRNQYVTKLINARRFITVLVRVMRAIPPVTTGSVAITQVLFARLLGVCVMLFGVLLWKV